MLGENGAATPPALALAKLGVVDNVRGYMVYRNDAASRHDPVGAVAAGEVDVATVWGPSAAQRQDVLITAPIDGDEDSRRCASPSMSPSAHGKYMFHAVSGGLTRRRWIPGAG